jgi:hypothetical protein
MKKREKIIGIIMLTVIALWAIMNLPRPQKEKFNVIRSIEKVAKKPNRILTLKRKEPSEELDLQRLAEQLKMRTEALDLSLIKDPFIKLEPEISGLAVSELVLSGIVWGEEKPMTLINDQILKEGDIISGFKIQEIRKEEVVLIKGMERYILKLTTEEQRR